MVYEEWKREVENYRKKIVDHDALAGNDKIWWEIHNNSQLSPEEAAERVYGELRNFPDGQVLFSAAAYATQLRYSNLDRDLPMDIREFIFIFAALDRLPLDGLAARGAAMTELGEMGLLLIKEGVVQPDRLEDAIVASWCAAHNCKERPLKNPLYGEEIHVKLVIAYGFLSAIWYCLAVSPVGTGDFVVAGIFALCGLGIMGPYPYFKIAAFAGMILFIPWVILFYQGVIGHSPNGYNSVEAIHWLTTPVMLILALMIVAFYQREKTHYNAR